MKKSLAERFWSKVDTSGGPDACWVWTAARSRGYGKIGVGDGMSRAHRVAWELAHGSDPGDMCVMHVCDNPPCCNPSHLVLGTHQDNLSDMISKGRQRGASGDRNPSRLYPERHPRGENQGNAKLTEASVREIRSALMRGERQVDIAKRFGVGQTLISEIKRGKIWKHVSEEAA